MNSDDDKYDDLINEQLRMKNLVISVDDPKLKNIKRIGGVDISFDKDDPDRACVYLIILDADTKQIIYEDHEIIRLEMPYVSGLLGFREVPHYLKLLYRLIDVNCNMIPDIILVDGFGTLHHRGFGSASHLGVKSDVATIGCAKTLINMDGLVEKQIKEHMIANSLTEYKLVGTSGVTHGMAIITGNSLKNPIYVSVGHKICLDTAVAIIKSLCVYRVPEPIRLADIRSKLYFK